MALVAGSVSISPDGTATGHGLSRAVYDRLAAGTALLGAPEPGKVAALRQLAAVCNAVGVLADYIVTNAQVSTTDAGTAPIAWVGSGIGTVA